MKRLITDTLLRQSTARPKDKPFEIADEKLGGFLLRVQPSGVRTYYQRTGRSSRERIGRDSEISADAARAVAKRIVGNVAAGLPPLNGIRSQGVTLRAYLDGDYKRYAAANLRDPEKALRRLNTAFEKFLDVPLSAIDSSAIARHQDRRKAEGVSDGTLLRDVAALSAAMSRAVKPYKIIESNPIRDVPKPKVDRRPNVRYLSADEEARLRQALAARDANAIAARKSANAWRKARRKPTLPALPRYADHLTPAVLLTMNTGLRRGELLALTWDAIDLQGAVLTIEGATAKAGQTRHVPLNTEAVQALTQWRAQSDGRRVFAIETGFKTSWNTLLKSAAIADFRWHDLRHHFASRLVQAGVPLNTVRELLGHADIAMTLRYSHLAPDQKAEAVAKLVQA